MQRFIFILSLITLLTAGPALARDYQLVCQMTDYGTANRTSGIWALVPTKATHVLSGPDARVKGTSMRGEVEQTGSRIKITYFGQLKDVGETEINYTYVKASGVMIAKTRGLRGTAWEQDYPERAGKYLVQGRCELR